MTALYIRKMGSGTDVYHTNPACPVLPTETQEITQEGADRRGLRECNHCTGHYNPTASQQTRCPLCGDLWSNLAQHLPACSRQQTEADA